ncbi:ParB family chromosome partitioning protein [Aquamicrobium terrae]
MAKAIQKITLNQAENIPFDKLFLSQKNVRRVKNGVSIEDLANDIALRGLLQSLNVRPEKKDGEETGRFEVPAGGRRFGALQLLIKRKEMAKTAPTPCIVNRSDTTSMEDDSLAENVHRENLHPLDQFRAFKALSDQGLGVEEIAARYLVSVNTVNHRLKLADVSPKLLALYEKGEIKIDQLDVFAISPDHKRQEQVWKRVAGTNMEDAYYIRRILTETTVRSDDRRAIYVGEEAYEAAGGVVLRDLVEPEHGNWFQDAALLEQLVFDKLKVDAEAVRAEGWKWVEAAISFSYGHTSGMRRIYPEPQEMSEEEIKRYDAVKTEYDALDAKYAEMEDGDEEIENKIEQLSAELGAFDDRPSVYDPAQKAIAGAFITLAANGQLQIDAGFVRPEDEPRVEADDDDEQAAGGDRETSNDDDNDDSGSVVVNGRPVNGTSEAADEPEEEGIKPLPDRLVFDLTAQKTLALRNALAGDVDTAFVAALHALVLQVFYRQTKDTCLEMTMVSNNFGQVQGLAETPWAKEIAERHEAWDKDMPDSDKLWEFLLGLDEASRKALFAHCASLSLNAVAEPWNKRPRAIVHADTLAATLGFDMVEAGWSPTVDNYLGRVTKARIVQAVREARGEDSAQLIDHMKKDLMAREAARLLADSGWLPEPLRLDVVDIAAEVADAPASEDQDEAALADESAELPAFLADAVDEAAEALAAAE